jgi:hypothetical protein
MSSRIAVAAAAAFLVFPAVVRASSPVGLYAIVDKVETDAGDGQPTKVIVHGVFIKADRSSKSGYSEPIEGYFYWAIDEEYEKECREEWAELAKLAGSGDVIATGSWSVREQRVRPAGETPEKPDAYKLNFGVLRLTDSSKPVQGKGLRGRPEHVKKLLAFPRVKSPAGEVEPGKVTLAVGTVREPAGPNVRYLFKVGGEEALVEPGEEVTAFSPAREFEAGEEVEWTVQVIDGDWKGPVATGKFAVRK